MAPSAPHSDPPPEPAPAAGTCLLVGPASLLRQVEGQLGLLGSPSARPRSLGWVLVDAEGDPPRADDPVLGHVGPGGAPGDLDDVLRVTAPDLGIVCVPAAMPDLALALRTRLRRAGVPDRFFPAVADLLAGVGPRSEIDVNPASLLGRPARDPDAAAIRRIVTGRRVLVTGAGGSIGGELARQIAGFDPALLILVDRSENALFEIDRQVARRTPDLPRRALLHDVVDAVGTQRHFEDLRPEVVLHAAAHKHVPMMEDHPAAAIDNNLFGTLHAVEAADRTGVERFVMISTDKAVRPSSVMGATKRLAELVVRRAAGRGPMACSMVRFGNVLGSSGSVLETWGRQLRDGGPITVTDPAMTRYFMTIPEAASLVLESAAIVDEEPPGTVFVLDMGDPVGIVDLARRFVEAHGLAAVLPGEREASGPGRMRIVYTGIRPGEKLHEDLGHDEAGRRPTRHPGIDAWDDPGLDASALESALEALGPRARPDDPAALVSRLHAVVSGDPATGRETARANAPGAIVVEPRPAPRPVETPAPRIPAGDDAPASRP